MNGIDSLHAGDTVVFGRDCHTIEEM